MIAPLHNVHEQSTDERVTPRLSVGVTRVSAMRILPVRDDHFALQHATVATDLVAPLRRMDPGPPIRGG